MRRICLIHDSGCSFIQTASIEKVHNSISVRNVRRSRRISSGNDRERSGSPVLVPIAQKRAFPSRPEPCETDDDIESLNEEIFKDFI